MSIELTTACLSIKDLSQTEKHILTILCFRAGKNNEVYSKRERLASDCGCSIDTIKRGMKGLREKGYLEYTGKKAPNSRSIPVYTVHLTGVQNAPSLNPRGGNLHLTGGQNAPLGGGKMHPRIDNSNKDNKKDIVFSPEPTQQDKNNIKFFLDRMEDIPDELQEGYLWLVESGAIARH